MNSKGISVLFLVIAMFLMITIGYVFSYLIPTKQKSVRFPIYSTQAFYIAQSGVEFAIRYCSDQGWRGATDGGTFDLNRLNGRSRTVGTVGSFTINYNNTVGDILTSTGTVTGSSENRVVRLSNFTPFLRLIFNPGSTPCRTVPDPIPGGLTRARTARFYIRNVRSTSTTLTAFSSQWTGGGLLRRIYMDAGAGWNLKYQALAGRYVSGSGSVIFSEPSPDDHQTIAPNQVITVLLYFNFNLSGETNFITTFYTAAGDGYTFNLDSAGNQLPTCP